MQLALNAQPLKRVAKISDEGKESTNEPRKNKRHPGKAKRTPPEMPAALHRAAAMGQLSYLQIKMR
jgi:hypothetical protein